MSIQKNLRSVLEKIAFTASHCGRAKEEIFLVAVSKGRSLEEIQEAYWAGCRDFAENRVQEALEKMEQTPADIRWHFIGKLQKNKVQKVVGRFVLIHSVDSVELAERVARVSVEKGVKTAILLEANTSGEASKSGLTPQEWETAFPRLLELEGILLNGLMTMAPFTEDESRIRRCFSELRFLRDRLQRLAKDKADLHTLSMGMTHDFHIAIQEGATLLRIGTALFHETC